MPHDDSPLPFRLVHGLSPTQVPGLLPMLGPKPLNLAGTSLVSSIPPELVYQRETQTWDGRKIVQEFRQSISDGPGPAILHLLERYRILEQENERLRKAAQRLQSSQRPQAAAKGG